MRHACAAMGCQALVGWRFLMCSRHWSLVPRELQVRVYATWADGCPTPDYLAAREAAIAAVVRQGELSEAAPR